MRLFAQKGHKRWNVHTQGYQHNCSLNCSLLLKKQSNGNWRQHRDGMVDKLFPP